MKHATLIAGATSLAIAGLLFVGTAGVAGAAATSPTIAAPSSTISAGTISVSVQSAKPPQASSVHITPDSADGCTGQLVSDNITNCIAINGSGLYVNFMSATAFVNLVSADIHVELTGPASVLPVNTPTYTIPPGDDLGITWTKNGDVPPGQYCAITWQLVAGNQQENGPACESVS